MKFHCHLWRFVSLMLALLLLLQVPAARANATDIASENGCHTVDAKVPLLGSGQVLKNAASAILYEYETDTLLYSWEADMPIYPASLVKILTALMVAEQGNMTEIVTVNQEVLDTVDSDAVSVDLVADEIITVEDLLYCMMVSSANDAAAVLADHIGGSQDAFVAQMNQYAAELGCTATNFVNVHGLHNDEQVTTVRDMTRILAAAVQNEIFMQVFGETHYTVAQTNKSEARKLSTGNYLMSTDEVEIYYDTRITGGRTGATAAGERCVASTASDGSLNVICIISGAKSAYQDDGVTVTSFGGFPETTQLLDLGFNGYQAAQIIYENQAIKQSAVVNGESDVVLGANNAVYTVLPADATLDSLRFVYSDNQSELTAPIQKGDQLSTMQIWNGTVCIGQTDLYAMNSVRLLSNQNDGVGHDNKGFWQQVLTAIAILLAATFVVLIILRLVKAVKITSRRNRARRYRRNRRRS